MSCTGGGGGGEDNVSSCHSLLLARLCYSVICLWITCNLLITCVMPSLKGVREAVPPVI